MPTVVSIRRFEEEISLPNWLNEFGQEELARIKHIIVWHQVSPWDAGTITSIQNHMLRIQVARDVNDYLDYGWPFRMTRRVAAELSDRVKALADNKNRISARQYRIRRRAIRNWIRDHVRNTLVPM